MNFYSKYIKYKQKYILLKKKIFGGEISDKEWDSIKVGNYISFTNELKNVSGIVVSIENGKYTKQLRLENNHRYYYPHTMTSLKIDLTKESIFLKLKKIIEKTRSNIEYKVNKSYIFARGLHQSYIDSEFKKLSTTSVVLPSCTLLGNNELLYHFSGYVFNTEKENICEGKIGLYDMSTGYKPGLEQDASLLKSKLPQKHHMDNEYLMI